MISDYFIKIEKYWFDDNFSLYNEYGEYGLLLYCSILQGKTIRDYCKFNIYSDLYNLLGYNSNSNRTQMNRFNSIFSKMVLDGVFEIYDNNDNSITGNIKLNNNNYKIYVNDNVPNIPKDKTILFFAITDDNFKKVLTYKDQSINIIKLFAYYCYISYITNVQDDYCKKSIDLISANIGISKTTVINYNKILSDDLGLIEIVSTGFDAKNLKEETNLYCLVEKFGNVKDKIEKAYGNYETLKLQKKERDLKRSIKLANK